jgi:hypothetical protein
MINTVQYTRMTKLLVHFQKRANSAAAFLTDKKNRAAENYLDK